jgi:signal transduction histidine kinase
LGADQDKTQRDAPDELRAEIAALRTSRKRLVLAADADLRRIERKLHQGVQQHLVALAVTLQLAEPLVESDPPAAKALLEEMGREVQHAVEDSRRLAEQIYAPLPELGGLAVVLRSVAAGADVPASVDVSAGASYPPEIVHTVYVCWLDALEHSRSPAITVRDEGGALTFEVLRDAARPDPALDGLRDRVEALGGRLAIRSTNDDRTLVSGWLPVRGDARR